MNNSEHPSSSGDQPDADSPRSPAFDWARRTGRVPDVLAELIRLERRRSQRRSVGLSLCLATTVAAFAVVLWLRPANQSVVFDGGGRLVVMHPDQRTLSDGSIVELKDGAEITEAFTPGIRSVTLQKGTAHFKVAKNPLRPFIVTAGGITVRAVGTAFCVDMARQTVDVVVTEGRVAVAAKPARAAVSAALPPESPTGMAMVGAGEYVRLDTTRDLQTTTFQVIPLDDNERENSLAWRMPRLDFSGTPLGDVVAAFNRYNDRQLVLAQPSLAGLKVSGTLRADKVLALREMLEKNFHLRVTDNGGNELVIDDPLSMSTLQKH
jgi:transmembrane sensor